MDDAKPSVRYWFVNCLGCKNPIPLFAEPADAAASEAETAFERPFFRAWCVECGREYPYLSQAMRNADEPPKDKHHHTLVFHRVRQRLQTRSAHA